MAKNVIYDIYSKRRASNRDEVISDRIQYYISHNQSVLTDGIVKNIPKLAGSVRDYMAKPYQLNADDWKTIQRSPEFSKMKLIATDLKLGLLISYCDTRNKIFILFLAILTYTGQNVRYFKNGYDPNLMKYTLEHMSGSSDFKKNNYSLLLVLNKKIDTFINLYDKTLRPNISDRDLRVILQSMQGRISDMVKNVAREFFKNYDSEEIKIVIKQAKTKDGKVNFSPTSVFSVLREKSIDNLASANEQILQGLCLDMKHPENIKYRVALMHSLETYFDKFVQITGCIIDDWLSRDVPKLLSYFHLHFVSTMIKSRNLGPARKLIDDISRDTIKWYNKSFNPNRTRDENTLISIYNLKNYILKYCIMNVYLAAKFL